MKLIIVLCAVALARSSPVAQNQEESVPRMVLGNIVNCMNSDLTLCLKEQALKATQRLSAIRQIKLFEGVTVLNNDPREAKSLDLSTDTEVRRGQVTEKLWESASDLLSSSELELSWNGPDDEEESTRALTEEGRGKKKKEIKKKLKILVPLLILAKVKAVALVVISLVVIAASLAKLAILAKLAFIAKAIAIIKYLLHQKKHQHEEHTAWIEHAPHEEHGGHEAHGWEGGWSRSRKEGNNLAYSAYANNAQ